MPVIGGGVAQGGSLTISSGSAPLPPSQVTSITKDAGATVSFTASPTMGITAYTVTPYVGASAQSPTTVPVASLTSLTTSAGTTALQAAVSGLTNGTAYTFTVKAVGPTGTSTESAASGANTPQVGLVFADEFNGTVLDPEWWVYSRCGYLAQSETEWYLPAQCVLDGAGNLSLTGLYAASNGYPGGFTGTSYPSNGGGSVTQKWLSGACQNNVRNFAPSVNTNSLTIETRFKICSAVGLPYSTKGMWPGLVWCAGTDWQTPWKTDPLQTLNNSGKWEVDIAEMGSNGQTSNPNGGSTTTFLYNISSGTYIPTAPNGVNLGFDASADFHVYSVKWKGTTAQANRAVTWYTDSPYVAGVGPSGGVTLGSVTNNAEIAAHTSSIFLNVYLQILNTANSDPGIGAQTCLVDYIRIYDQAI